MDMIRSEQEDDFDMDTLHLLGFDFGASSGRAMLGTYDGQTLQLEELHRFSNDPVMLNGRFVWDIQRLFFEMKAALLKAVKAGIKLDGIGIDTWGVDFGLLDQNGRLLGVPVHYRDARTDGMMEEAFKTMPKEEIFEATGLAFMQFNTLYQLLAMKKENDPTLDIASTLLFTPDLLAGIRKNWGGDVVSPDSRIDRAALSKRLFSASDRTEAFATLNALVHPAVERRLQEVMAHDGVGENELVLVEVPLLFEIGWESKYSHTIAVWMPREKQIERLMARNGLTREDAESRLDVQMSADAKLARADFGLINNGGLEHLRKQCFELVAKLKSNLP